MCAGVVSLAVTQGVVSLAGVAWRYPSSGSRGGCCIQGPADRGVTKENLEFRGSSKGKHFIWLTLRGRNATFDYLYSINLGPKLVYFVALLLNL